VLKNNAMNNSDKRKVPIFFEVSFLFLIFAKSLEEELFTKT
jgi:hypothetical protein